MGPHFSHFSPSQDFCLLHPVQNYIIWSGEWLFLYVYCNTLLRRSVPGVCFLTSPLLTLFSTLQELWGRQTLLQHPVLLFYVNVWFSSLPVLHLHQPGMWSVSDMKFLLTNCWVSYLNYCSQFFSPFHDTEKDQPCSCSSIVFSIFFFFFFFFNSHKPLFSIES